MKIIIFASILLFIGCAEGIGQQTIDNIDLQPIKNCERVDSIYHDNLNKKIKSTVFKFIAKEIDKQTVYNQITPLFSFLRKMNERELEIQLNQVNSIYIYDSIGFCNEIIDSMKRYRKRLADAEREYNDSLYAIEARWKKNYEYSQEERLDMIGTEKCNIHAQKLNEIYTEMKANPEKSNLYYTNYQLAKANYVNCISNIIDKNSLKY